MGCWGKVRKRVRAECDSVGDGCTVTGWSMEPSVSGDQGWGGIGREGVGNRMRT